MKNFKKIISLLLITAMLVISFSSTAFATDITPLKGADTITSEVASSKGLTLGLASRELVNYSSQMSWSEGPEIDAQGAYLIELNTGAVLYSKSFNEQFYPASITKILTALVVIEHADLDEMVTFSHDAIYDLEDGGYSYIAEEGDKLSVRDCLYGLMLMSSNECAYALAEHVGGSISGFASMMNEKAKEVGAYNSNFCTPHGLTNSEHVTTPHDMACIMWAAIQNPTFLEIDSTVTYTTAPTTSNPDGYYCTMRHSMMHNTEYYDERVIAGKTGYTSASKNTLVTYAKDGDKELICVVMCVNGTGQACIDTKKLIDYGFNSFDTTEKSAAITQESFYDEVKEKAETAGFTSGIESISYSDSVNLIHPEGTSIPELSWSFELEGETTDENLVATNNGNRVLMGEITYYIGEKVCAKRDVTINLNAEETGAIKAIKSVTSVTDDEGNVSILKIIFLVAVVLGLLALITIIVIKVKDAKSRKRRRAHGESRKRENL